MTADLPRTLEALEAEGDATAVVDELASRLAVPRPTVAFARDRQARDAWVSTTRTGVTLTISAGLLAESRTQLRGVVCHELGHIALGHRTARWSYGPGTFGALAAAVAAGSVFAATSSLGRGWVVLAVTSLVAGAGSAWVRGRGRRAELDADMYAVLAGEVDSMLAYLEPFAARDLGLWHLLTSPWHTHPSSTRRVLRLTPHRSL